MIVLTKEQEKLLDSLSESFGFKRVLLLGFNDDFTETKTFWMKMNPQLIPTLLQNTAKSFKVPEPVESPTPLHSVKK
jgi:hypothetical protein